MAHSNSGYGGVGECDPGDPFFPQEVVRPELDWVLGTILVSVDPSVECLAGVNATLAKRYVGLEQKPKVQVVPSYPLVLAVPHFAKAGVIIDLSSRGVGVIDCASAGTRQCPNLECMREGIATDGTEIQVRNKFDEELPDTFPPRYLEGVVRCPFCNEAYPRRVYLQKGLHPLLLSEALAELKFQ